MPRRFKIFSRCEGGAAAVEFALCLPLLVLLLAGFIDFGWWFFWQHTASDASRAGARYGVQANYPGGIRTPHTATEIQNMVTNNYGSDLVVTVVPGNKPGDPLSVTVTKTMEWVFLWFATQFGLPSTISNTTTMTME